MTSRASDIPTNVARTRPPPARRILVRLRRCVSDCRPDLSGLSDIRPKPGQPTTSHRDVSPTPPTRYSQNLPASVGVHRGPPTGVLKNQPRSGSSGRVHQAVLPKINPGRGPPRINPGRV